MITSAHQSLQIACNMNKCQYSILSQKVPSYPLNHMWVYISLNTIIDDWLKIHGRDMDLSEISLATFSGEIFELVCHYKRFYGTKLWPSGRIYVLLYYSLDNKQYNFASDIVNIDENRYSPELINFITDASSDMKVILDHIPGSYIINTGPLPESIIPYYITYSGLKYLASAGAPQNSAYLIVSKNPIDYQAMWLADKSTVNSNIYTFRRKSKDLYDRYDVISKYIYKDNVKKPRESACTHEVYNMILISNSRKLGINNISQSDILSARSYVRNILGSAFSDDNSQSSSILNMCVSSASLSIVDMSMIFAYNEMELRRSKMFWKVDKLDFSLECVNETWYREHRLDIQSLLIGVRL